MQNKNNQIQLLKSLQPDQNQPREFKVTPEILQIIYLDEIASRLEDLFELERKRIPQGRIESYQVTVDDKGVWVRPKTGEAWFAVSIINDGDADVYFASTEMGSPNAPLKKAEVFPYNAGSNVIGAIFLYTTSGTATVRIIGML